MPRHDATPRPPRFLTALPVYNEASHVAGVLDEVLRFAPDVLVVDDGSADGTSDVLARRQDIHVVRHPSNRGYGAALTTAFAEALAGDWDGLVTIDCDGQHQPQLIPEFIRRASDEMQPADIVSGSRYLQPPPPGVRVPADRRQINHDVTAELNQRLGFTLTDAFCGFKAYTRRSLECLHIQEPGYAMPLEVWVQAAAAGLRVVELPVPLIYLDESRSFGGSLDDAATRLEYYRCVLDQAEAAMAANKPE